MYGRWDSWRGGAGLLPPQLRDASAGGGAGHPDRAAVAGALERGDDDNLYPRAEQGVDGRGEPRRYALGDPTGGMLDADFAIWCAPGRWVAGRHRRWSWDAIRGGLPPTPPYDLGGGKIGATSRRTHRPAIRA